VLTSDTFQLVKEFVLDQGKRQTYCASCNNNPYYGFSYFNVFLRPSDPRDMNCEIGKSDFNTMVIQTPPPCQYWHVTVGPEGGLSVWKPPRKRPQLQTPSADVVRETEAFFERALKEMREMKSSQRVHPIENVR